MLWMQGEKGFGARKKTEGVDVWRRGKWVCSRYYHCLSDLNCKKPKLVHSHSRCCRRRRRECEDTCQHTDTDNTDSCTCAVLSFLFCERAHTCATYTLAVRKRDAADIQCTIEQDMYGIFYIYMSRFQRQFRKYFSFGNGVFHFSTSPSAAMKTFAFIYNAISGKYEKQHSLYYSRSVHVRIYI